MNDSSITPKFFSVGIVTDPNFANHLTGFHHPESPKRVDSIIEKLRKDKWLIKENTLAPRMANTEELTLAHSLNYIKLVEYQSISIPIDQVRALTTGDVMISKRSFEIAKLAVGGILNAIDAVFDHRFSSVFCVVRPPGHHACHSIGMGFCLFNNVAIGAFYALKHYPIKRLLIVDWDLHHGNGTEELVKNHPEIFYFSTHQKGIWPGTGSPDEKGCNNIHNTEVEGGITSRQRLLDLYAKELKNAMSSFKPELILISAGFDAHLDDPLGNLQLTAKDFGTLTDLVCDIAKKYAGGRVVSVLEGGYNLEALAESALEHVKALNRNA